MQAASGKPEAVNTVLQHYQRHIYFSAIVNGQFNPDAEDYITQTLLFMPLHGGYYSVVAGGITLLHTFSISIKMQIEFDTI